MSQEVTHTKDLKLLNKIIREYEKSLIQFAFSYIADFEASEDYVFESFLEFWNNRDSLVFEDNSKVLAYFLTVVKHKCLNHLRKNKNKLIVTENLRELQEWELDLQINSLTSCDPKELFTSEINEIVEATLNKLPPDTKKIFCLSRYENKSRKEIAEIMGMSVKGVEYHISKALSSLRINLKDYWFLIFLTLYN